MPWRTYVRWREERMSSKADPDKKSEPLAYGLDLLPGAAATGNPVDALREYARRHRAASDVFFRAAPVSDYCLQGNVLTFTSPLQTETPANNQVCCRVFESRARRRAVLLLPHWNSSTRNYDIMGRCLKLAGITAACMSMPYHDARSTPDGRVAPMVSANLGLTIRSCRQAVLDARAVIEWLQQRGHERIGVLGVSLGTCIASLTASHDRRVQALALLLTAGQFGEAVWTSRATRHVRKALEGQLPLEQLNDIWSVISPLPYVSKLRDARVAVHVLSALDDTVFLPHLTAQLLDAYRLHGLPFTRQSLPCGHYTLGILPFSLVALHSVLRFFGKQLA